MAKSGKGTNIQNDKLFTASENGDKDALAAALESGAEVDARDHDGLTPLMVAAKAGKPGTMEMLFKAGADPTLAGPEGNSLVTLAATGADNPVCKSLIQAWAHRAPELRREKAEKEAQARVAEAMAAAQEEAKRMAAEVEKLRGLLADKDAMLREAAELKKAAERVAEQAKRDVERERARAETAQLTEQAQLRSTLLLLAAVEEASGHARSARAAADDARSGLGPVTAPASASAGSGKAAVPPPASAGSGKAAVPPPSLPLPGATSGRGADDVETRAHAAAAGLVSTSREKDRRIEQLAASVQGQRAREVRATGGGSPRPLVLPPVDLCRVVWDSIDVELGGGAADDDPGSGAVMRLEANRVSHIATNEVTGVEVHLAFLLPQDADKAGYSSAGGRPGGIVVPTAARAAGDAVVAKIVPATAGPSVTRALRKELAALTHLAACQRVVAVRGRVDGVTAMDGAGTCTAVLMERGGVAFADCGRALVAGRVPVPSLSCLSGEGFMLASPTDCSWLPVAAAGPEGKALHVRDIGTHGSIRSAVAVARTLGDLCGQVLRQADTVAGGKAGQAAAAADMGAVSPTDGTTLGEDAIADVLEGGGVVPDAKTEDNDSTEAAAFALAWRMLPFRQRLRLAREAAWALAEVHAGKPLPDAVERMTPEEAGAWWAAQTDKDALGLVHRDVKPANLLVFERYRVKIADFGEATLRAGSPASLVTGGGAGRVVGTPSFVSPEMWAVRDSGVTLSSTASDVHSLGMSLAQLVMLGEELPLKRAMESAPADPPAANPVRKAVEDGLRPRWDQLSRAETGEALADQPGGDGGVRRFWGLLEQSWQPDPEGRPSAVALGCAFQQMLFELGTA